MIYHIAIKAEWESQAHEPEYAPKRYQEDGFIHCSEQHQLEVVASRHFQGRVDLLLLEIVPTRLEPETRYEQGSKEKFPHIYGRINRDAVNRTIEIQCNDNGLFEGVFDGI